MVGKNVRILTVAGAEKNEEGIVKRGGDPIKISPLSSQFDRGLRYSLACCFHPISGICVRTSTCHSRNTAIPVRRRITDYAIVIPMRYVFFLRMGADAALRAICRPRRPSRHRSRSAPKARALLDVFQTRASSTSSQRSSSSTYRDDVLTHHSYLLT